MQTLDQDDIVEDKPRNVQKKRVPNHYIYLIIIVTVLVVLVYILLNPLFVDLEGQEAPDFSVKDIDGNVFSLSANQGKVVVLDIMTISCSVCKDEMEHLRAIYSSYSQDELVLVTISIDSEDSEDALSTYRSKYGDNWTFARDTDGVANKYRVSYIPTIVIIDKEGTIRFWRAGEISASKLSSEIEILL